MSGNQDDHAPAPDVGSDSLPVSPESDKDMNRGEPSSPDSSVISEKLFVSPKGNVYRIIKTNEVDDYQRPRKRPQG
jgi:hypothetical protein